MFFLILAAVLLPSGFSASLTTCDGLTQQVQIQGRDQFLGVWTYAAESTNMPGSKLLTKMFVENVWGKIYPANESDSFFVFQVQKMLGRCFTVTSKLTLVNNALHMDHPIHATEVLVATSCSDCLVLLSNFTLGESTYKGLQLLSKRPKLTQAEMEEFKRQAACLDLPPPTILNSGKDFCPDESSPKDSETTDLTSVLSQADPEYMKLLDKMLSSRAGLKTLVDIIARNHTLN
ncbi:uncharacterized protein LOC130919859 isoform X2 [Corythoichthys intestinalis]|uniref:uncharacterized protein LOC130919859 isoform X2 n=1 Tax=Corythoichthys intestinalis TaxID=161448 RepID=UPI0025A58F89|nr:uncharacterized protein LOC130919859 isoform X2 [Corythoichthys intestinalis]